MFGFGLFICRAFSNPFFINELILIFVMRCILFSTVGYSPLPPPFRLVLYLAVVTTIPDLTPGYSCSVYFVVLFYCYRYFLRIT